jgi:CPA1 family monovalent cation:H+ antiporter
MSLFHILAVLLTASAIFSYINYRFLKLPTTIGIMLAALCFSLLLNLLGPIGIDIEHEVRSMLGSIDFDATLLHGMLSFLLFAGALHVDLSDLAKQRGVIIVLATAGVVATTFIIGGLSFYAFELVGLGIPFVYCLLFGALISPTDPIAVLGILKQAHAPKSLEAKIAGESLFNDGMAVVVFLVLIRLASGEAGLSASDVILLFSQEAIGGVLFGLGAGAVTYWMLKSVDNYQGEVLLTLALVTGGYALAEVLHLSAPVAIVCAGLLIGNHGRTLAMSEKTRGHLDTFWELVDEVLNAVLFVLIGLEVLALDFLAEYLLAGLLAIPIVLVARFTSVGIPITVMRHFRSFSPRVIQILTWGGLRGGISVALALSLPANGFRDALVVITYIVVIFSILIQGLSIGPLIRASNREQNSGL